jgi:ribulose-5-phosphate 4-epimerase/fuculose-1-phosphate aldolase
MDEDQDVARLRERVADACRILAHKGLVDGILGHVSARVDSEHLLIRCRGPRESGLAATTAEDVRLITLDGRGDELDGGWRPPAELPIHSESYRRFPEVAAVVHAHPPAALLCGLSGIEPKPVFGAYNIPAMRMALDGVPTYPRSVLITRSDLAAEMVDAMGDRPVCILAGHGITTHGDSVEQATVRAVNLEALLMVTIELARLGAAPPTVPDEDLAELPDLGSRFNDELVWRALLAEAGSGVQG